MPTTPSADRVAALWAARTAADPGEVGGGWEPGHLPDEGNWEPGYQVPRGEDPMTYEEQGSQVPPRRDSYGVEVDADGNVVPRTRAKRVAAKYLGLTTDE